jgi:ABC-type uncharacterized transport system ATPase subunit
MPPIDFLSCLVSDELTRRGERLLERRKKQAEFRDLTKHYGYTTAVRQVSFSIGAGEILGYLGPNGAGKRTPVGIFCFRAFVG